MLDKFTQWVQNIILLLAALGSAIGALYLWAKDKFREAKTKLQLKEMKKDIEIANEPSKDKKGLLEWLRGKR